MADSTDWWDTGQSLASEFVKSYGLRYEDRQWSWSLDNIGREFKEHPFWTTVDYLLVGVPVAKWGQAAYRVSSGVGAAGRLYNAAKVGEAGAEALAGFGEATTRGGRFAESVGRTFGATEGFGRAYELERAHGVAQTGVGRFVSSYSARRADDPEWQRLVDAAGGPDPNEMKAWGAMLARDRKAEGAAMMTEAANLSGRWKAAGVTTETAAGKRAGDLVHRSLSLGHSLPSAEVARLVGKDVDEAYQASLGFRRRVHDGWHDAGFTPDEVWEAGYDGYMPRVYAQWERIKAAFPSGGAGAGAGLSDEARGAQRALSRKWSPETVKYLEDEGVITRILDPGVGMLEIGRAGMKLAGHNYAKRLAQSAAVRSADDVLESAAKMFGDETGDALTAARRAQYTDEQAKAFNEWNAIHRSLDAKGGGAGTLASVSTEEKAAMMRRLGWKPMEEVIGGGGMPGHLQKIAKQYEGRWVDPAAIEDFKGVGKIVSAFEALPQWMMKTVGTFKYTHTVLNAATQVRNVVGSVIFHHLSVGGLGIFDPKNPMMRKGARALAAGATGVGDEVAQTDWKDVLRTGLVGSGHSADLARDWERAIGAKIQPGKGVGEEMFYQLLDWLPGAGREGKVAKTVGDLMTRATKRYQYTDDLAKADAFLVRRDVRLRELNAERADLIAKGDITSKIAKMSPEELRGEAIGRAMVDVAKFQPMFSQVSPLANAVRDAAPFSSFTTEAVRVWKNAIVEKPVLAFAYNHMVEAASHVTGAIAGFDERQLAEAEQSLPWHMQGKKSLVMPMRVDGKPVFVDFSYMIPMANLPETVTAESSFFDMLQINPFKSNPLLAFGSAAATGLDPFTKRPIEPAFTERQLGVAVDPSTAGGQLRKAVGLAEYAARQLLPPLAPPGSAGVNLLEFARGQKHGFTGQELETGIARTIGSNFFGFRSYQGDMDSQLLNAKHEDAKLDERTSVWWSRWKESAANGDAVGMERALGEVASLRRLRGDDDASASKYIVNGIKQREPGKFRGLSTREIQETLERAQRLGGLSDSDKQMRSELMARLQERAHSANARKRKRFAP